MKPGQKIATHKIEKLVTNTPSDRVRIADLINAMEGAGFGLTLMVFALGILVPLPPPFPSFVAIPLLIFSFQMMIGLKSPRLPKKLAKMTVKRSVLATLVRKSSPYIGKVEKILRPRLIFMILPVVERFVGAMALIFAGFVLIPLPLSNFIPGFGVLMIAFGLLGRDGLMIILGILVGFLGVGISLTAMFVGLEALGYLKDLLF